jgi:hypothetical protein
MPPLGGWILKGFVEAFILKFGSHAGSSADFTKAIGLRLPRADDGTAASSSVYQDPD